MSVEYTARGSGYYRVFVDGDQVSQHIAEREAIERATNEAEANPNSHVYYDHDYEVDVAIISVVSPVDTTAPTLQSATVPTAGTTISFVFDEVVYVGAGGNGGFTIAPSGGASTLTYSSGDGTDTLVYSLSRTVQSGETATCAYTQPGNGVEDNAGNDLVTFSGTSVTNNSTASGTTVLWASDPDTTNPWNFDSFPTSGDAYTATVANDADYGGNLIEMTMVGDGQQPAHPPTLNDNTRGGDILDAADNGNGDFYIRFLIKYSLSDNYDHWNEGTPAMGFGWEYKFFDIGDESAGGRIIIKHKNWGDEDHGHIFTTINGSSGEANKAWGEDLGQMFVSNTLYYIEIGILADGTLKGWYAVYDGTDTEYSEGTPDIEIASHHSWTPGYPPDRTFDFFRNHTAHDSGETIRFHLAINDSFIGPGAVSSTY